MCNISCSLRLQRGGRVSDRLLALMVADRRAVRLSRDLWTPSNPTSDPLNSPDTIETAQNMARPASPDGNRGRVPQHAQTHQKKRTTAVSPMKVQQGIVCRLPLLPNTPRQWLRFRPENAQKLTCRSPHVTRRVPDAFHATLSALRRPPLAVACTFIYTLKKRQKVGTNKTHTHRGNTIPCGLWAWPAGPFFSCGVGGSSCKAATQGPEHVLVMDFHGKTIRIDDDVTGFQPRPYCSWDYFAARSFVSFKRILEKTRDRLNRVTVQTPGSLQLSK